MNANRLNTHANVATLLSLALFLSLCETTVMAQPYDLSWHTVDGGGAMNSAGGGFELSCTIGQSDAGPGSAGMSGGSFELTGGFWAAPSVCTCPGDTNGDGQKNGRDIQLFVNCLVAAGPCSCADVDGLGGVSLSDVAFFVDELITDPNCP